jgi:MFS family permease
VNDVGGRTGPQALWTPAFVRVTLAHLTFGIGGAFGLHLSGMLKELGAGEAEIGRIMALTALTALVLSPFAGKLLDQHGRPLVMRIGGAILCAGSIGYALASELAPVYALRVLEGLGATFVYAGLFTYAGDIIPAGRRTHGLALFGAAGLAPLAISSLGGDALLAMGSYRVLYAVGAAFLLLGVVLTGTLPDARPKTQAGTVTPGLRATARQRDLLPIWAAALTFFFAMSGVGTFLKTLVLELGEGSVGVFFSVYALVAVLLRVLFGGLPDRVGPRRMVLPALLAYAAGCLLLARTDADLLVLAGALCGAGHGYGFPVFLSLTVSRAREEARGSATAIFTTVDWAGHVAAPPLAGLAIERLGYGPAFGVLAAALGLGIVAFYALDRGAQKAEQSA